MNCRQLSIKLNEHVKNKYLVLLSIFLVAIEKRIVRKRKVVRVTGSWFEPEAWWNKNVYTKLQPTERTLLATGDGHEFQTDERGCEKVIRQWFAKYLGERTGIETCKRVEILRVKTNRRVRDGSVLSEWTPIPNVIQRDRRWNMSPAGNVRAVENAKRTRRNDGERVWNETYRARVPTAKNDEEIDQVAVQSALWYGEMSSAIDSNTFGRGFEHF